MKIAALYARVSGEQQRDSNTIASQTEALVAYAERHGYHVASDMIIEDDGYSGAVLERPGLERVRDLAAEGRIDTVVVHAPDRLSRRYAYQVLIIEELARQGVETVFVNAPSMETPEEHLLVQFQGMIAEYERAQILERSRRGKRHRARRGDVAVLSGAPYGYRYHKKTPDSDAFYEIAEPQASVVRDVYRYYTCDHMSIGAVARKLNERAVPTSTGRSRWERSVVWAMLRNPAYKGSACFGKTRIAPRQRVTRPLRQRDGFTSRNSASHERPREDWIEIPVPAIVSEHTFALAAERLQKNKIFSKRRTRTPSVLQGLVACGKCGYALSRTSAQTTARKISYYRCLGSDSWRHLNGALCDSRPVRQDLLDDVVWSEVVRLLEDPALVSAEIERRLEAARASDPNQQRETDLRHRLIRVRKSIDRLVNAYQEELITIDELRDRTPELRRQEQALHRELQSSVDRAKDRETYLRLAETLSGFLARLRSSAETLDIVERQRIVRLLVKEVLVSEDNITIRHSIPISGSSGAGPDPSKSDNGSADGESYLLRSRRHHPTLRDASLWIAQFTRLHHASVHPLPYRSPYHPVLHPLVQKAPQVTPVHASEEVFDVKVNDPTTSELHQTFPQRLQRLVCAAPGPESVRAIQKILLVHRLQHHQHRALEDFVLQRWNADRACLARARLLQVYPAHRRRTIPTRLEPFEQPRQVRLHLGLVVRRRHPVHSRRRVLAGSPVGFAHPHIIPMMRQRRQGQLRLPLSQLRYLALSR